MKIKGFLNKYGFALLLYKHKIMKNDKHRYVQSHLSSYGLWPLLQRKIWKVVATSSVDSWISELHELKRENEQNVIVGEFNISLQLKNVFF